MLRFLLERAGSPERSDAAVQAAAAACIELVLAAWPDVALRRVSAAVCDALLGLSCAHHVETIRGRGRGRG